jgi:predicted Zn-dependent peptidase
MIERSQLANGIRVVTERMAGVPSATLGIWVESGSRHETRDRSGISHFIEHLLFKGTERRSAADIAEQIDSVGGVLNAFTGKECTCYYARVLAEDVDLAADVLSDLFLGSIFDEEEIERERGVILQEISQGEDTPDEFVHDVFNLNYWRDHPLGLPICGYAETVSALRRSDFLEFLGERYRPDRIVVAAAGNLRHADVLSWVERDFGALDGRSPRIAEEPPAVHQGLFTVDKSLEQLHLCLGTPGISQGSDDRYAAYLLNTALGGGMSSRLFQEIREKRGRAYSVYSFLSCYRDTGYLGVYAGTSTEWADEVIGLVIDELRDIARSGLRADELERSKRQLKGGMLLGLETSDSRMSRLAKNEIYFGRHFTIEEVSQRIDETTNEEIVDFAARLTRADSTGLALLGKVGDGNLGAGLWGGLQGG